MGKIREIQKSRKECRGKDNMKQKETEEQLIERRKKMYGCDGKCYCDSIWDGNLPCSGVCGRIDTCEETKAGEAVGSCLATLCVLFVPTIIVVLLVLWFCFTLFS